uniref:Uncharacterized protein n=1 Tax=Anabas testudineus TaxID=64144 RepID=A0A7N6B8D4_ANATE
MKEATLLAETLKPALSKRAGNINKGPGSVQTTSHQMESSLVNRDKSPPKKKKTPSKPSMLESGDLFEATTTGANREVSMLFIKFAEVLSEKAAADSSQMKELEGILKEARNLECYLKEKKKHLRQTLALISDKLQG